MSIPKFHEVMLPLLQCFAAGGLYHRNHFVDAISDQFELTPAERSEKVSSGWSRITDRVGWATTFLKKAELIESPKRGYHQITQRGQQVLAMNLDSLSPEKIKELFPDVLDDPFYNSSLRDGNSTAKSEAENLKNELTPEEILTQGVKEKESEILTEILENVKAVSPRQFEVLVVKVLIAMGYGTEEFSAATQYTNDGGIDGIIQADELGFEKIFVQAKKYEANVGRPDIQKFVGAMTGTSKGIFITTSDFVDSAKKYVEMRPENVILINGVRLARLMFKYNQGVSVTHAIEMKSLDSDFFEGL